ncbi:MAG: HIT domain-containing protein [Rickettsiales bacterium]|jgi:diadenosine tetraphosphate (Ap4A) HIT family hydrolase|nr:HIT domain-containing protein [Rickettsiales bacterium]
MVDTIYDNNNVFAKILRGEIPCDKVYEDDFAVAFPDLNPKAKTHILVIPKGDYTDLYDFIEKAPADFQVGFWAAVRATAKKFGIEKQVMTLANTGAPVQSVFHFHIHLLAPVPFILEKRIAAGDPA